MNNQQKRYALDRIERILRDKTTLISEACTLQRQRTGTDLIKGIRSGKIRLQPDYVDESVDYYDTLGMVFNIPKSKTRDDVKYRKLVRQVTALATSASDQLMLGDCDKAMEILAKLDEWKP